MKTFAFYLLVAGAVVAWLWTQRRKPNGELDDQLAEHTAMQKVGQIRSNGTILAMPPLWGPAVDARYRPNVIFNPQVPTTGTANGVEGDFSGAVVDSWSSPVYV